MSLKQRKNMQSVVLSDPIESADSFPGCRGAQILLRTTHVELSLLPTLSQKQIK
jgi:hypothetical protein